MNLTLQFHDSEVARVESDGDRLSVRFSAASVRQGGGGVATEGHVSNLEMLMARAAWSGSLDDAVGRLSSGSLRVDDEPVGPLALPLAREGRVAVTLSFANGAALSITAASIALRFDGEPRWIESYAC